MKQTFRATILTKIPIVQCQLRFVRGAIFVKKNSCLVARIVSFDTVGTLLTFRILEPYLSKDILALMILY